MELYTRLFLFSWFFHFLLILFFFLLSLISKCFILGNYSSFFFFEQSWNVCVAFVVTQLDEAACAQHGDVEILDTSYIRTNFFGFFFMQCFLCMLRWKKEGAGEEIVIFYVSLSLVFSRQFLKNSMFRCDKSRP